MNFFKKLFGGKKEEKPTFQSWLDKILSEVTDEEIIAFNFNLYEMDGDRYDAQLVGCKEYSEDDSDWACAADFSSGEDVFIFYAENWENALNEFVDAVKKYLENCDNFNRLKRARYVTVGFVDGDLEVIQKN